jgi:hypothetical protein
MPRHSSRLAVSAPVLAAALAGALALSACQKKEDVIVAAPVPPVAQPGGAAQAQPASGQAKELPPGHPPLDQASPQGDAPSGMGGAMGGPMAGDGAAPPAPPHGGGMSSAGTDVGDVKVARATGKDARTVAEVFAQKAALKGKTVTVRGKVVKYNAGIMGKNWIHLRDGTGAAGKDNDVTVTTQDPSAKGEVVTVQGTVAVDQDIGMGTPYPVIIQDAKVTK